VSGDGDAPGDHDAHEPVLVAEAIGALAIRDAGVYVDGTFGRGGHSRAILARLGPTGRLLAFDRDPEAERSARRVEDPRFAFERRRFSTIPAALAAGAIAGVDGVLLDLGVSSPQLADVRRGFSFRHDGPLDMRMDPTQGAPAWEWVASASEQELERVIADYGEERAAGPIARAIVAARARERIVTTRRLAEIVAGVTRRRARARGREAIDPATRTFQAIRIHVNEELAELPLALEGLLPLLNPHARLAVISFHSLEDRIVKTFIRRHAGRGEIDPRLARLPVRLPPAPVLLREAGRLVRPGPEECARNPRARSARMRVAERTENAA
jgi:16S rRNA (cytosine1402-N4)-methyltransferase